MWLFMRVFGDTIEQHVGEERRLFYVAATRAQDTLVLCADEARMCDFLGEVLEHREVPALYWDEYPPDWSTLPAMVEIRVFDAFEVKDLLKTDGFRWDANGKYWHRTLPSAGFSPDVLREARWMTGEVSARVYEEGRLAHNVSPK